MDGTDDIKRRSLLAKKDNFKQQILENLTELYFLRNNGLMCDYHTWAAKEVYSSRISNTNDEDILDDQKFSHLFNLRSDSESSQVQSSGQCELTQAGDSQDKLPKQALTATTLATVTTTAAAAQIPPTTTSSATATTATPSTPTISTPTTSASTKALATSTIAVASKTTPSPITITKSTSSSTSITPATKTSPPSPTATSVDSEKRDESSSKRKRSQSPVETRGASKLTPNDSISPPVEKKLRDESPRRKADETKSDHLNHDNRTQDAQQIETSSDIDRSEAVVRAEPNDDQRIPNSGPPDKKDSPTKISKVVDPIVTPTIVKAEVEQRQIFERARHEAYVIGRISELRRQGLWSAKRLPKLQEPPRPKTHWDYLLDEMEWLSTDFILERKWKRKAAKKCALMVHRYHQEKRSKIERAEREHLHHIKKLAASQAKEIRSFWSSIEKIVDFRQQTKLEETRKKAWGLHLNYILDQTSKFSNTCLEETTNNTTKDIGIDYLMNQESDNDEKEPVINVSICKFGRFQNSGTVLLSNLCLTC